MTVMNVTGSTMQEVLAMSNEELMICRIAIGQWQRERQSAAKQSHSIQ